MIDKGICDTVLFGTLVIVNVSDKSCDISKYLNNKNCKCRSKLTDKLVNKCSENTLVYNGTSNYHKNACNSCMVYIVLFAICFIISISIISLFIFIGT